MSKNTSISHAGSSLWRLADLAADSMRSVHESAEHAIQWPHPDYAAAAQRCTGSPEDLRKLEALCDDLESTITKTGGPASLARISGFSLPQLQSLIGKCWREILAIEPANECLWRGVLTYARALKAETMDDSTRRTGVVLHCVALMRLENCGIVESDETKRKRHLAERRHVLQSCYVPEFVKTCLGRDN